jgi:hypothetical protein
MRLTVMGKGLTAEEAPTPGSDAPDEKRSDGAEPEKLLERLKWHLWRGNVYRALQITEDLEVDLESQDEPSERSRKLLTAVREFRHYLESNRAFIPNYGDRYRHGERIAMEVSA